MYDRDKVNHGNNIYPKKTPFEKKKIIYKENIRLYLPNILYRSGLKFVLCLFNLPPEG